MATKKKAKPKKDSQTYTEWSQQYERQAKRLRERMKDLEGEFFYLVITRRSLEEQLIRNRDMGGRRVLTEGQRRLRVGKLASALARAAWIFHEQHAVCDRIIGKDHEARWAFGRACMARTEERKAENAEKYLAAKAAAAQR